ncbi:ankyrin repeat domain-containing protein [Pyxidicoccus parkwayensis]|uniref:Ankyrin repeat domain-containing protein n=1 Tax=Pyxidicoccus parkwayensis TaxID=2813578 RepID=A0ABX7P061_9BACT|nr:ankyrin repeat domain-containing protein [Pyxidicoccus parkwaysis]QSQ23979.1 ankyrin repeat domain-containing protein [Pyxidicoccus parkwaysis]
MTERQYELTKLIHKINDLHFIETYDRVRMEGAAYLEVLHKAQAQNAALVESIRQILAEGVSLDFKTINNHTPLAVAVTHNNVELIQLLMDHGADIRETSDYGTPLHRAAEFGADKVVRFLIERGLDPRGKTPGGMTVLTAARSSRHSKNVVPLLVELLKPTKSQRPPPPKKLKELSEENILRYLAGPVPANVEARDWESLKAFMDSLFVEEYSVTIDRLYEEIEAQGAMRPHLVFACIDLIKQVSTKAPASKTLKKVSKAFHAHHGDLVVDGALAVRSLMVTGNLTVKGKASNPQGRQLFVGGDFECDVLYTEGPVLIGGDLRARTVDAYYNDYALEVRGVLKADTLTVEKHQVKAGRFEVKERIDK